MPPIPFHVLNKFTTALPLFKALYPPCTVPSDCKKDQFCAFKCWTGGCGATGKKPVGTKGKFCQPCPQCVRGRSVTGNCEVCEGAGKISIRRQITVNNYIRISDRACYTTLLAFFCLNHISPAHARSAVSLGRRLSKSQLLHT